MADSQLITILSNLNSKIERLIENQKILRERINELEKQNSVLEAALLNDKLIIEQANKNIEFLSMSYRLADDPETIILTRRRIAWLIGTINDCIRMINEE